MAQQVFSQFWPLGQSSPTESIPGAAILQTRDGKDEPITLAGNMVFDSTSGLWVPVSQANRLPVEATLVPPEKVGLKRLNQGQKERIPVANGAFQR